MKEKEGNNLQKGHQYDTEAQIFQKETTTHIDHKTQQKPTNSTGARQEKEKKQQNNKNKKRRKFYSNLL